ncbi:MAG: BlaI/MecI/CopY family transcriptional regulator [Clostridia bacterium]|nr:BlaI/MecI/CopY family transcriptional regulator [Clostridia bacterium]
MNHNILPKISESELEVMRLLWEWGEPMTVTQIRTEMALRMDWEAATIKTLLSRLYKKGAVERTFSDEQKVFLYSPLVSKEDYGKESAGRLIGKIFDGSAKKLVASLIQSDRLTKEDIAELYEKWGSDDN